MAAVSPLPTPSMSLDGVQPSFPHSRTSEGILKSWNGDLVTGYYYATWDIGSLHTLRYTSLFLFRPHHQQRIQPHPNKSHTQAKEGGPWGIEKETWKNASMDAEMLKSHAIFHGNPSSQDLHSAPHRCS